MHEQDEARMAYAVGQTAFERGSYREAVTQFERAAALAGKGSVLGGEIQLWLANAYAAVGEGGSAIATCQALAQHPDSEISKQSKRLAYILQAPELATKPEWMSQIPDLGNIEGGNDYTLTQSKYGTTASRPRRRPMPEPEPIDLSQVNTQDNQFVWVALFGCVLVIGGLLWFS
ncbi:MAG: tetratricopeptide repeat protein [Cyanobacteria bacterium J06628_4]